VIEYARKMLGILTRFDEAEMRAHTAALDLHPTCDEVFWRMWHKARTASLGVPDPLREESRAGLIAHDSEPWG
jgi:hypothetical protein